MRVPAGLTVVLTAILSVTMLAPSGRGAATGGLRVVDPQG